MSTPAIDSGRGYMVRPHCAAHPSGTHAACLPCEQARRMYERAIVDRTRKNLTVAEESAPMVGRQVRNLLESLCAVEPISDAVDRKPHRSEEPGEVLSGSDEVVLDGLNLGSQRHDGIVGGRS